MSTTDKLRKAIGGNQVAVTQPQAKSPATQRRDLLMDPKTIQKFATALPRGIDPNRFARVIWTEVRKNPLLINADAGSLLSSCITAAQLGLEVGSHLGQCYLVPFNKRVKTPEGWKNVQQAQLIIGYRGLITLARKSGEMVSLNAFAVFEKDDFSYQLGLHPDVHHVPSAEADRGALTYVYAVANFVGGGIQFEVMSRAEIEAVRDASQGWISAKQSAAKYGKDVNSPWATHFNEMAKKTVVRRLAKYLPLSVEAARAVEVDEAAERGEVPEDDYVDATFIEKGGVAPDAVEDIEPVEEAAPSATPTDPNKLPIDQKPIEDAPF